jgi:hypothetical protein
MERVAAFLLAALITGCACADVGCNNVLRVHPNVDLDPDIRYGVRRGYRASRRIGLPGPMRPVRLPAVSDPGAATHPE